MNDCSVKGECYIAQYNGKMMLVSAPDEKTAREKAEYQAILLTGPGVAPFNPAGVTVTPRPSGIAMLLFIRDYLSAFDDSVQNKLPVGEVGIYIDPKMITVRQEVMSADGSFYAQTGCIHAHPGAHAAIFMNICTLLGLTDATAVASLYIEGAAGDLPVITRRSYLL